MHLTKQKATKRTIRDTAWYLDETPSRMTRGIAGRITEIIPAVLQIRRTRKDETTMFQDVSMLVATSSEANAAIA